jgi:hypothetical protein
MTTRAGESDHGARGTSDEVVTRYEERGFIITEWKNVSIVVWGTQATIPLVKKLRETGESLIGRHPEGISAVHIIANGVPLPDSATRAELNRLTDAFAENLACIATVLEGSGFWASAMHSFVTGIQWVSSRRPFKSKIGSTLADAAGFLPTPHHERTHVRVGSTELLRVITTARERVR